MPLVAPSTYVPPRVLRDGHALTVFPTLSRRVPAVAYRRERIDTPDGDFLDLDWSRVGASRVAVVSHGLEGSSSRSYVLGMVRALNRRGWDVVAWNFRGCSGEVNRRLRFTHSGASDDLATVLTAALAGGDYRGWALVGFSLGGNLTLKLLGEDPDRLPPGGLGAVAFSVPCDLRDAAEAMASRANRFYMRRFLSDLSARMERMRGLFPGRVPGGDVDSMRTFREFDDRFTAPLHGFADAVDYWTRSSSRQFLLRIRIPTLLVNARDDPFLGPGCFPEAEAQASVVFHLEAPERGGHVGFVRFGGDGEYWSEQRAGEFLDAVAGSVPG